jgi:hypothetical protein
MIRLKRMIIALMVIIIKVRILIIRIVLIMIKVIFTTMAINAMLCTGHSGMVRSAEGKLTVLPSIIALLNTHPTYVSPLVVLSSSHSCLLLLVCLLV